MKQTLLLSTIFLFSIASFSQIQFNRNYSTAQYHTGNSLICNDSIYYLLGTEHIDNDMGFITVWKFDSLGNFLWEKNYGDGQYFYSLNIENTCIRDVDGFFACGSKGVFTDSIEIGIMLYKFNSAFDTLWTKNYLQDTIFTVAYAVTKCSNGDYIIAGSTERDAETGIVYIKEKALLLKVDSDGNYLWHKTYGTEFYNDKFYKIVQTPDGGFLCGGASQSYGSHTWDWYLVKTDVDGNEEWNRTYGSTSYDDGRIMGITMTTDTNYIITGSKTMSSTEDRPHIIKLDKNFVLEIDKILPFPASSSLTAQVKEIEGNQLIAIGSDRMNTNECTHTTLTKFNSELNIIWRRKYTVGDTTNTENYIYSVDTCSDGGYVLGGWASHSGQKLALIKTDSLGCDGTDWWECSTGVMVNEFVDNPSFEMYPNPAEDFVVINCHTERSVESIQIYNMQGQLILNSPLEKGVRGIDRHQIDISQLEQGVYIVRLGKQTKKLIIE